MQANLHIFGFFESFDTVDIMNGPICHSKKKKKKLQMKPSQYQMVTFIYIKC